MMDPIGFAMENFDGIGRWRAKEDGAAIDASGTLFTGAKLDGVAALRQELRGARRSSSASSPSGC